MRLPRRTRSCCSSSARRDHSRSSIMAGSLTATRRNRCGSVRSPAAATRASRRSSLAPAMLNRSRSRSSCFGLIACTAKPRSSRASTTGPCGTSIATATAPGSPATDTSQSQRAAKPAPSCRNARSPTTAPESSSRQTWCFSDPQSTPANQRLASSVMVLALPCHTSHRDGLPIPVPALEGATSYWASVVANSPGHMSHHGARGTGWTAGRSRRAGSPDQATTWPTRRPWRVQGGRPPTASRCQGGGVERPPEEASVAQASTIGLDIAKRVFQAHGADATGRVVFRKRLVRAKVLEFFAAQPPCVVALEACGGAHHWAREINKLGHTVRLIPPAYVKPFVKRQKNDVADAEAICEAAQRPGMRFVPVKDEAQQANAVVFRARDLLVRQRTQCINALRGHLAEYGHVAPQGPAHVDSLVALVEDPKSSVPGSARGILQVLIRALEALGTQLEELDAEINRRAKADPAARRLTTIPGIAPIAPTAIPTVVPGLEAYNAGRDFAAWLGLTPLQKSTGGKHKLGAISKRGEQTIRRLLILGASAVVRWASQRGAAEGSWLARMLPRKPRMLVTVALANKTARIVWALLVKGGTYKAPAVAA